MAIMKIPESGNEKSAEAPFIGMKCVGGSVLEVASAHVAHSADIAAGHPVDDGYPADAGH
ncbi:MAG: hypothetical protein Q4G62_00745 [Pseudomonadota bacterium]|nr:hypothetical protein [Pseudomonadota bacterium]